MHIGKLKKCIWFASFHQFKDTREKKNNKETQINAIFQTNLSCKTAQKDE